MNRNPDISPQLVLNELGRTGAAAKENAKSAWEQTQQKLREEAFVKALLLQVPTQFNSPPSELQLARIKSAKEEQLCCWIQHCASAQSLDELLERAP